MKTLLLLALLLASAAAQAQTVLRVNNTAGSAAPYTTIDAAVTAAGVNDIIMVEGSNTNYGDITINKKVTIIGPGYLLNANSNLQATRLDALVKSIVLNSGANGSSISGLVFDGYPSTTNTVAIEINNGSNITITNNVSSNYAFVLFGAGNNIVMSRNYFSNVDGFIACNSGSYTGVLISNNYIGYINNAGSPLVISNNTINGRVTATNSFIQNNVFLEAFNLPLFGSLANATIKNNVFVFAQFGLDATNLISQPTGSLFVGLAGNTTDTQWRLKAGSPAIGAGIGGTDCGMYGGTSPYRPSGIALGQATITDFDLPATVPKNGVLNVKVSGRVN